MILTKRQLAKHKHEWGSNEATNTVQGVRIFKTRQSGELGGQWGGRWQPGENVAQCFRGGYYGLEAPKHDESGIVDPDCTCGFYGWYPTVPAYQEELGDVFGVIEGYGRTLIGSIGFRAERAQVVALCAKPLPRWEHWEYDEGEAVTTLEHLETIARRYDVPILPDLESLLAAYPLSSANAQHA